MATPPIDYEAVIADLEAKIAHLQATLAGIRAVAGLACESKLTHYPKSVFLAESNCGV